MARVWGSESLPAVRHSRVAVGSGDADVIHQCIEPDIGDVVLVEGQRNAPVQPRDGPRDAKVFEHVVLEEAEDFVAPIVRLHKRRVRFEVINQPLLMRAELEPIVALLELHHFAVGGIECAVGPAVLVGQKRFFLRGIKAFVGFLIKLAGGVEFGEDGLHEFLVARLGGADEIVVGEFELLGKRLPVSGESIAIGLGVFPSASAACCTFWPCSSRPVRKNTSWPRLRRARAITSATIFS